MAGCRRDLVKYSNYRRMNVRKYVKTIQVQRERRYITEKPSSALLDLPSFSPACPQITKNRLFLGGHRCHKQHSVMSRKENIIIKKIMLSKL